MSVLTRCSNYLGQDFLVKQVRPTKRGTGQIPAKVYTHMCKEMTQNTLPPFGLKIRGQCSGRGCRINQQQRLHKLLEKSWVWRRETQLFEPVQEGREELKRQRKAIQLSFSQRLYLRCLIERKINRSTGRQDHDQPKQRGVEQRRSTEGRLLARPRSPATRWKTRRRELTRLQIRLKLAMMFIHKFSNMMKSLVGMSADTGFQAATPNNPSKSQTFSCGGCDAEAADGQS